MTEAPRAFNVLDKKGGDGYKKLWKPKSSEAEQMINGGKQQDVLCYPPRFMAFIIHIQCAVALETVLSRRNFSNSWTPEFTYI